MPYKILCGDVLDQLKTLTSDTVQCVITSPPYWGLRDYGTGTWLGGDPECNHVVGTLRRGLGLAASAASTRGGAIKCAEVEDIQATSLCPRCGAERMDAQLGLESTPEAYVDRLVEVFREVRRVLSPNGTAWVVLGDSYAASRSYQVADNKNRPVGSTRNLAPAFPPEGLKQKDLMGMPWRVAFALQADGWYLRQDIIWAKPNPMPESVTDRCTKSHEHIFLLSKSAKYYYNNGSIKELAVSAGTAPGGNRKVDASRNDGNRNMTIPVASKRNKRDVWTIATQPYRGAHFAVFPEKLVEPCILAGTAWDDVVLDPFCGSGTVGVVAQHYGRNFIGIELNQDYVTLAHQRMARGSSKLNKPEQEQDEQGIGRTVGSSIETEETTIAGSDPNSVLSELDGGQAEGAASGGGEPQQTVFDHQFTAASGQPGGYGYAALPDRHHLAG